MVFPYIGGCPRPVGVTGVNREGGGAGTQRGAKKPELNLLSLPRQEVEAGQTLRFQARVAEEGYWRGKIEFSFGSAAPPGATIDPGTGEFEWSVPRDERSRSLSFTIVANAGDQSDEAKVVVAIAPVRELVLLPLEKQWIEAGQTLHFRARVHEEGYWRGKIEFSFRVRGAAGRRDRSWNR